MIVWRLSVQQGAEGDEVVAEQLLSLLFQDVAGELSRQLRQRRASALESDWRAGSDPLEQWSGLCGCGADNSIQLAWHPQWAELLAIAAGSQVLECSLPALMESEPAELVCVTSQPPPGTAAVPFGNTQPVTAIAFSLDGSRLAAGTDDGNVSHLSSFQTS